MVKYRLSTSEVATDLKVFNSRPHGLQWKPQWEFTLIFDTEEEREKYLEYLVNLQLLKNNKIA